MAKQIFVYIHTTNGEVEEVIAPASDATHYEELPYNSSNVLYTEVTDL